MDRRAFVVVTAGCGAITGQDAPETLTALLPGVTGNGVADVSALIRPDGFVRSVDATYVHDTETRTVEATDRDGRARRGR